MSCGNGLLNKASVEQVYHRVYLECVSDHMSALAEHIEKEFDIMDSYIAVEHIIEFEIRNLRNHISGKNGCDLREVTKNGWLAHDLEHMMFPGQGNGILWARRCPINGDYCMRHAERLFKKGYRGKELSRRACLILEPRSR